MQDMKIKYFLIYFYTAYYVHDSVLADLQALIKVILLAVLWCTFCGYMHTWRMVQYLT